MDFTSLWILWQKHHAKAGIGIIIALSFLLGWQGGRITSPYYAATPIVFEEIKSEDLPPSDLASLESIKQQGVAARKPAATQAAVAGTATQAQAAYVASKNSSLYHHISCPSAKRIAVANQRWFKSPEEAQKAGFSPSQCAQEYIRSHP